MKKYFADFDLLDETPDNRYRTVAAHYYKRKLYFKINGEALVDECPEYLEGKTIMDQSKAKSDSDEGDVDPVDPLVDMFWSGVKATESMAKSVMDQTDIVKKSKDATSKLYE